MKALNQEIMRLLTKYPFMLIKTVIVSTKQLHCGSLEVYVVISIPKITLARSVNYIAPNKHLRMCGNK